MSRFVAPLTWIVWLDENMNEYVLAYIFLRSETIKWNKLVKLRKFIINHEKRTTLSRL